MLTPTATSVMQAVPHLGGMLMVICTLALLWGICATTAKILQIFFPPEKVQETSKATQPLINDFVEVDQIPSEIAAVIAAAVVTVTGRTHRIVSIKRHNSGWDKSGRQSVLSSHKIR